MKNNLKAILPLFGAETWSVGMVPEHEGGRNRVFIIENAEGEKRVLRISMLEDRTEEDYLAETEFIHYLADNGASVADVIPSVNGRFVEHIGGLFASLFEYAPGMLISDNGYRYRDGAPLEEYFFLTGKTLGKIHALSKKYQPVHHRPQYFDKYNMAYIDRLIPDSYAELKHAISSRLEAFHSLPQDNDSYGTVHFDYSDGNYHIDMDTGRITVFDFDNCINCWYMFDLANLWTHGEGWFYHIEDGRERAKGMQRYFDTILAGYRTETDVAEEVLDKLPLFIDMVLIENIVDEFECCERAGEPLEYEDIEDAAECLMYSIPYAGILGQLWEKE